MRAVAGWSVLLGLLVGLLQGCGGGGGGSAPAASAPDTSAPSVTLNAPQEGARLVGVVPLSASASDNVGVSRVEFYLNGTLKGSASSAPYTVYLDTSTLNRGSYTLIARAFDGAGNVGQSPALAVTVPISVFMTTQVTGTTAVGTVYLAGVGPQEAFGLRLTVTGAHVAGAQQSGTAANASAPFVAGSDVILPSATGFGPGEVLKINFDGVTQPANFQVTLSQVLDSTFSSMPLQ